MTRGPQLNDKQLAYISGGRCPRCHYRGFVIGPMQQPGPVAPAVQEREPVATINIECGSVKCRERYNVAFWSGNAIIGHHLGNGYSSEPWPSEPPRKPS